MSNKTYIIDGYNLIHKSKKLSKVFASNIERAREELVSMLSDFFSKRKEECILVFDGKLNITNDLSTPSVRVIFSHPPDKADDLIKKIIMNQDPKRRKNFIVVSSDNEIINCAKACGAERISSEEFLKNLSSRERTNEEEEKPFVKLTEEEIKRMLQR
ncbi:Predicted RNA-binding protein containing a PIN domain [Candidatus Thermokryptus mobilis]|uniref:Predicted RNA-binding protein containing a PIN domain n=1 Tax=Candidatus Thermokryptus mobilis TaxID=1643428 RepID=A0A0S4MYH0_9BACT|nr:NYN domain-containing protein [Candidatus Thermokryptus mobilis]CUU03982.1 Predicted RNA-binding protein containing a PIN domain [Candidatus Thermokryptus mobilis]